MSKTRAFISTSRAVVIVLALPLAFFLSEAGQTEPVVATANDASAILPKLFIDPSVKVRPSNIAWPTDVAQEFIVLAPEAARSPASVAAKKTQTGRVPTVANRGRRSRLPASVRDGLELRVRYNNLTSMFWIYKKQNHLSLLFSNSAKSQASLELSEVNFNAIMSKARSFPGSEMDISKCPQSSLQLNVLADGRERTFTTCVNTKSKPAAELRDFSQALANLVM